MWSDTVDRVQLSHASVSGSDDGATSTRKHFGYLPPLDGIRALAVLGVIGYHMGIPFLQGGFLGVDAFFVLSGFLITSLLLEERIRNGNIGLRAFWARRARRLLPALILMIIGVLLYVRFIAPPGAYPELRLDALSTLFYVANWHFILVNQNYFVLTGLPTPLLHTWSLAIEEQFYLVWPFIVLAVMRTARTPKRLMIVSTVMAIASAVEMALLYRSPVDTTRVYFGTDTHSSGLLLGAALASGIVWWRGRDRSEHFRPLGSRSTYLWLGAGIVGFVASAIMWWKMLGTESFPYRGGIFLASLAVFLVIGSVVLVPSGILYRLLSFRPLRYIGKISYGMYLWHWPLIIMLNHSRTGLLGWNLVAVRLAATILVATVSFYAIERPIRQGTLFRGLRAWVLTPLAMVVMTIGIIIATIVPASAVTVKPPPKSPSINSSIVSSLLTPSISCSDQEKLSTVPPKTSSAGHVDNTVRTPSSSTSSSSAPSSGITTTTTSPSPSGASTVHCMIGTESRQTTNATPSGEFSVAQYSQRNTSLRALVAPSHPVRVLVVGDSVALTLAYGLDVAAKAEPGYDISISDKGILGCGIAIGRYVQIQGKTEQVGWPCNPDAPPGNPQWPALWAKWISQFKPDVVVLLAGRWEVANRTYHGKWTNITNPAYAAYIKDSIERAVQVGTSRGADMILDTAPCYNSGEQPNGLPWPEDSPVRLSIYNNLLNQVASSVDARHPGEVYVQHLHALVCPSGRFQASFDGVQVRSPDGVHFTTPQGGEYLATKVLPTWKDVGVVDRLQRLINSNQLK